MNLGSQVSLQSRCLEEVGIAAGRRRSDRPLEGAVRVLAESDPLHPPIDLEDSTRGTTRSVQDRFRDSRSLSCQSRDHVVVAVDSDDRYDHDREGRTVRQDGGPDARQDIIHQKPTGLPWDQE